MLRSRISHFMKGAVCSGSYTSKHREYDCVFSFISTDSKQCKSMSYKIPPVKKLHLHAVFQEGVCFIN